MSTLAVPVLLLGTSTENRRVQCAGSCRFVAFECDDHRSGLIWRESKNCGWPCKACQDVGVLVALNTCMNRCDDQQWWTSIKCSLHQGPYGPTSCSATPLLPPPPPPPPRARPCEERWGEVGRGGEDCQIWRNDWESLVRQEITLSNLGFEKALFKHIAHSFSVGSLWAH